VGREENLIKARSKAVFVPRRDPFVAPEPIRWGIGYLSLQKKREEVLILLAVGLLGLEKVFSFAAQDLE
jgi:hypothetical protein